MIGNLLALIPLFIGWLTCAVPTVYLLGLLVAAAFYRRPAALRPTGTGRFVILIPAHDEELTLPASLARIRQLRPAVGPQPLVVVVADNCQDGTAQLARESGATVYERHDPARSGKGQALAWAVERLLAEIDFAALVVLDADTLPAPDFLIQAEQGLAAGGQVWQGRYDVLEPDASWRTRLMYSAFVIYNHIRPLGRLRLGLSDGLRGNGMIFRREILERFPWQAFGLVEDLEYTTRLAMAGVRITYLPQAVVYGQAAASGRQATSQRLRWEGGRWQQARQDVPRLLGRAARKGDLSAFDRAMDLLIPPLALLALALTAGTVLTAGLYRLVGGKWLARLAVGWLGLLAGLGMFVLGGLAVARSPLKAYLALACAPFYIIWKIGIYCKLLAGRAPRQWVRTGRTRIELSDAPILDKRGLN